MKKLLQSLLLILVFCGQACVEPTEWDYKTGENGKLVVESILTTEHKKQEVRLSLSYDDLNGEPVPVTDATVWVNNGQADFPFAADTEEPGRYLSAQAASVEPGVTYQLHIDWKGESYTAQNKLVFVSPLTTVKFEQKGDSQDSLQIANPPNIYSANEQLMYEFYIDWSALTNNDSSRAKQIFYAFNTLDVNGLFRPRPEKVYFPKGSQLVVKKYGLNDDFAAYLRALAMETEWQAGLLDEASASLPTNISNGGLGYFAVCGLRMDTLIAE